MVDQMFSTVGGVSWPTPLVSERSLCHRPRILSMTYQLFQFLTCQTCSQKLHNGCATFSPILQARNQESENSMIKKAQFVKGRPGTQMQVCLRPKQMLTSTLMLPQPSWAKKEQSWQLTIIQCLPCTRYCLKCLRRSRCKRGKCSHCQQWESILVLKIQIPYLPTPLLEAWTEHQAHDTHSTLPTFLSLCSFSSGKEAPRLSIQLLKGDMV